MTFTVTVDLPADVERRLRVSTPDLGAAAKEAFLVAAYRQGNLTRLGLSQALGLDRFQTEDLLHRHNVTEDLGSAQEYVDDAARLADLLKAKR